jgi:mRNA interferase HigB
MRIIAKATLRAFWQKPSHRDAEQPLKAWYEEAAKADWSNPNDVKAQFRSVSVLNNNRLVFNIAGNKYRLIVAVNYRYRCMYICFVGTHKQYDKIDAEEVWEI